MSVQKRIQDYYEDIYKLYPTLPKQDIRRILLYGWKSFYLRNSCGGDVCLQHNGTWFYSGRLMVDSIKYYNYYRRKMIIKLRYIFKRKKIEWDEYYYFSLYPKQYQDYLSQKNKKGRPRKYYNFKNVFFYKLIDECNLSNFGPAAIFRIPASSDLGFKYYKEEFNTDKAELLYVRDSLKFKDILLSEYNYQFISDITRRYKKKNNEQ